MGRTTVCAAFVVCLVAGSVPAASAQTQPTLTIYSSLPLQGVSRAQASAIVKGARLALEERGHQARGHVIRFISLDDSSRRSGHWSPRLTSANARRAAVDPSAIAYIGEFNSGASSISIPILNEASLAQISPSNTAIGLTRAGPGADRGEPDKYYPSGTRNYVRISANDTVQGGALAVAMKRRGCRRVAAFHDGEVYGAGVGYWMRDHARRVGVRIVYNRRIDPRARGYSRLARAARMRRPNCTVFTGITANGAVQLFEDLGRALPRAKLFGSDGVAESTFSDPRRGGIPPAIARRVLISLGSLAAPGLPTLGRTVLHRYRQRYREASPDAFALNGYEAMQLALDGVEAAGPDRRGVVNWLFSVRDRESVFGTYSIDQFGDTTLRTFGLYGISGGAFNWAGAVEAPD